MASAVTETPDLLARYDELFNAGRVTLIDIGASVVERATTLRARHNLKTPDALHVASAIVGGATTFLTGDSTLSRCSEIDVEVLIPDEH